MTDRHRVTSLPGLGLPVAAVLVLLVSGGWSPGHTPAASPQTQPVPDAVAAPIRNVLSSEGVRVTSGGVTLDFWLVKSFTYLVLGVPTSAGRLLRFGLVLIGRIDAQRHEDRSQNSEVRTWKSDVRRQTAEA